jgi:hypothetical protein
VKTPLRSSVELLEARVAPAAVFHFVDMDGDKVTIVSSKGSNFDLMNAAHIVGGQLQTLDLSGAVFGAEFDQADITISAVRAPGGTGDGKVNVGYLKVVGEDLGAVTIDGDLGRIDVGDGNAAAPALASLTVGSIYRFGKSTQDASGGFPLDGSGPRRFAQDRRRYARLADGARRRRWPDRTTLHWWFADGGCARAGQPRRDHYRRQDRRGDGKGQPCRGRPQ